MNLMAPRPPWRVQDPGDALLGRSSRTPLEDGAWLTDVEDIGFETDADSCVLINVDGAGGKAQVLGWPMILHRHGQDCGRA
jgi:hypothetical protein